MKKLNPLQKRYWKEGFNKGLTVAEFEKLLGLMPYSIFPEAANVVSENQKGFYMYRKPRSARA